MNIAIQFVHTKSLSYFYEKIDSTNYLYKHVSLVLKKNCIPLSMVSILLESKSPFLSATSKNLHPILQPPLILKLLKKLLNFTKKRIAQSELSAYLLGDPGGIAVSLDL